MTASAIFRMSKKPYVVGGAAMWWGYVRSMFKDEPRYEDAEFRAFLRAWQWRSLLDGKAKATSDVERTREKEWRLERAGLVMPCQLKSKLGLKQSDSCGR